MKKITFVALFLFAAHVALGQSCGFYRIEYVGEIKTTGKEVSKVYLPTTILLHRVEPDSSEYAFTEVPLTNGSFKVDIRSHLTTPYESIDELMSFFKKQADKLKIKIVVLENGHLAVDVIEIDWNKIEVSKVDDGKRPVLFRLNLKDISI